MQSAKLSVSLGLLGLAVLLVAIQGFVWHALNRGISGLAGVPDAQGRLAGSWLSDGFVFGHMAFCGIATLLAVLQLAGIVRKHWPWVHRILGRALVMCALVTGIGGLGANGDFTGLFDIVQMFAFYLP